MESTEVKSGLSRGRLLKRAGVGAVLLGAPVMATSATAQRLPRFTCRRGGPGVDCQVGGDPCSGQRDCQNNDERGTCSCLATRGGRCFCHEFVSCAGLTPCTGERDCPDGYACTASCCSYDVNDTFCHPPCGTVANGARVALKGRTSAGYIA